MEQDLFCVNCGQKLGPDIKFCPKCGTKVTYYNDAIFSTDDTDEQDYYTDIFYQKFKEKIESDVIEAYLNNTKVIRNGLYSKGERYHFTNKMVDNVISSYEKKIHGYEQYLDSLYISGNFILKGLTPEIRSECESYATIYHEIDSCDGGKIYDKFVEDHKIREKYSFLMTLLLVYEKLGDFNENCIKADDSENIAFKENEFEQNRCAMAG